MTDDPHSNFQFSGYENDLSFHWQVQLLMQLINYFLRDFLKAFVEEGLWFLILIQFSMLFVFFSCELTRLTPLLNH